MGDLIPRNELVKQGLKGAAGIGGGIGLFILRGIASPGGGISIPGLIVGGIVTLAGLVIATSKEDRNAGMITAGAGAATGIASLPLVGATAGWLMGLAGFGLIGAGAYSLFKFFKNLRKRM